jgi:hypothetical protein
MADKPYYPEGFEKLLDQIDDPELVEELSKEVSRNEKTKAEYAAQYSKQIDGYNLANRTFGNVKPPIKPSEYAKQIDKSIIDKANKIISDQKQIKVEVKEEKKLSPELQRIIDTQAKLAKIEKEQDRKLNIEGDKKVTESQDKMLALQKDDLNKQLKLQKDDVSAYEKKDVESYVSAQDFQDLADQLEKKMREKDLQKDLEREK